MDDSTRLISDTYVSLISALRRIDAIVGEAYDEVERAVAAVEKELDARKRDDAVFQVAEEDL